MTRRAALPRICIALGFPEIESLLAHAREEYNAGERFFEFRLDYLAAPGQGREKGIGGMRKVLARNTDCRVLAACRRHQNHGHFNGSIEQQLKILDAAIEA